jgi:hypothetical protein
MNSLAQQVYDLIHDYETKHSHEYEAALERVQALEKENAQLKAKLAQHSNITYNINDDELKSRLEKLGAAPSDTFIREAGVILENRVRRLIGDSGKDAYGVNLIDLAFKRESARFRVSQHAGEQDGIHMLFRGAMQFIRNPPMHKLIEYPQRTTQLFIALIDSLLVLLSEISQPEQPEQAEAEKTVRWTPDKLEKEFQALASRTLATRLRTILDLSRKNAIFITSTGKSPAFGLKGRSGKRVVSFDYKGGIYFSLRSDRYETDEQRKQIFEAYRALGLIDRHLLLSSVDDGRYAAQPLSDLAEGEFSEFIKVIEGFCL